MPESYFVQRAPVLDLWSSHVHCWHTQHQHLQYLHPVVSGLSLCPRPLPKPSLSKRVVVPGEQHRNGARLQSHSHPRIEMPTAHMRVMIIINVIINHLFRFKTTIPAYNYSFLHPSVYRRHLPQRFGSTRSDWAALYYCWATLECSVYKINYRDTFTLWRKLHITHLLSTNWNASSLTIIDFHGVLLSFLFTLSSYLFVLGTYVATHVMSFM